MPKEPLSGSAKTILGRLPRIVLWVAGVAIGRWAGLSFVIPAAGAAAAYFALKRLLPTERELAIQLAAVQFGHWGWMCLGLATPGGLVQVGVDVALLAILLLWFGLTRRRAPAYCLLAFQVLGCAMNFSALPSAIGSSALAALSVHLLFRLVAIVLILRFLVQYGRTDSPISDPQSEGL